jgi:hypothetical protein
MSRFPVRLVHGNLMFGPREQVAALYRLSMVSYPFLPTGDKWALAGRLERLAQTIAADFSVWRITRAYPAEEYVSSTRGLLDPRHQQPAAWDAFLEGHRQRLAELEGRVAEVYLAVSLVPPQSSRLGTGVLRASDRLRDRVESATRMAGRAPLPASVVGRARLAERRLFERLATVVALRRARTVELQWLLRRAAGRGLGEPRLEEHWKPAAVEIRKADGAGAFEPVGASVWRLSNCAITEHERALIVDGEEGRSYQAMLAAGALGEAPQFPGAGAELLFAPLEELGFAVDSVLHARWWSNREALRQVRKRIADVEHAYRDQVEGAAFGPGVQAEEDRALAREYEATLQTGGQPAMLTGWVGLALGAPTPEELERRVQALRDRYGDVQLFRPAGLQHQLWLDHLPRPDGGSTADYAQQLTVEQFGTMVATATRAVGSHNGPYLGYTPSGVPQPVRLDATEAPRESRASAMLLVGSLGSGKTVAAQAIAYAAERRGSLVVDFDPKPDHGWEKVGELTGRVEVIELSGEPAQQGRLDPFLVAVEELREEIACSYLLELLRDPPATWENAITRAVRDAARHGAKSLHEVIALLQASEQPAALEAGEALAVISEFGLARLGFAPTARPGKGAGQ